ncbi:hypothetical protein L5876_06385 [Hyphobacterium sp. SN044]|uniref:RyR domain-containing protein n=1 Tax=Hyphobacterium sp. SN044 TaxID=2912575 RepID=UPI001EEEBB79|nr:RyR domain-containing protein [Hyphobacterium sp. SN044]MCF8879434.1 hypothetical protein [Hyphobacterium sp. SN044]
MMALRRFIITIRNHSIGIALLIGTIVTFALAFSAWNALLPDSMTGWERLSQAAYLSLRAFVFGDEYAGIGLQALGIAEADGTSTALQSQLHIARWTGAFVALGAILKAALTVFREPLIRVQAIMRAGHAVVFGDSLIARKFAEDWATIRKRAVTHHAHEAEHKWDGVLTLPRNARLNARLTLNSLRWADRIVISESSEAATIETALEAARQRPGTPTFAIVRDPWLAEHVHHAIEHKGEAGEQGDLLITVSEHSASARAVLHRHPAYLLAERAGHGRVHILIAGFGGLGEALVRDLLHTNLVSFLDRPMITVLDLQAPKKSKTFALRYPGLADHYDISFIECDAAAVDEAACTRLVERLERAPLTAAYVTTGEQAPPLAVALALQEQARRQGLFEAPIFIAARDGAGLPVRPGGADFQPCELAAFGSWSEINSAGGLLDREPDQLAREVHETYLKFEAAGEASVPWPRLKERFRNSNRRAVAHTHAKLASLGFDISPLIRNRPIATTRPVVATGETLFRNATEFMNIARLEHERWNADRLVDGWRYGPTRDDLKRTHPNLVSFDELPPDIAAYDIRLVARLADWVRTGKDGIMRSARFSTPPPERGEDREALKAAGIDMDEIGNCSVV